MDITITRHDRDLTPDVDNVQIDAAAKAKHKRHPGNEWYPDSVNHKYLVVDTKVFRDQVGRNLAFQDFGDRLEAARPATADTIADMVATAAHRGWHRIAVDGDRDGRREAWLAARLQGLEVTGYEPSKVDLAALEKAGGIGARAPAPVKADGAADRDPLTLARAWAPAVAPRAQDAARVAPQASSFAPTAVPQPPAAEPAQPWRPNAALQAGLEPPAAREATPAPDPLQAVKDAVAPVPQVAALAEPTREGERRAQLFAMAEANPAAREQAIREPAVRGRDRAHGRHREGGQEQRRQPRRAT